MITSPADTLVCDTAQIAVWQSKDAYDYNRELIASDIGILELIQRHFREMLRKILGSHFAQEYSDLILVTVAVVLLLLIAWFIYRKHSGLFMRSPRDNAPYTVEEDTIYGVDFSARIGDALAREDYREAVRLLYLQTLKQLSDVGRIDWQPYKTPTQYNKEVNTRDFKQLTSHFLRVRYGNFEASEELFRQMQNLQTTIGKGGEA